MSIYLNPLAVMTDDVELRLPTVKEIFIAGIRRTVPVALTLFHNWTELQKFYHSFDTEAAPKTIPHIIGRSVTLVTDMVVFTVVIFNVCENLGRKLNEPVVGG